VNYNRLTENRQILTKNRFIILIVITNKIIVTNITKMLKFSKIDKLKVIARRDIKSRAYSSYSLYTTVGFKPPNYS